MKIGDIVLKNQICLAPLAGYTNLPFRLLACEYGAAAVFTEMISAKGLYYKDPKTASLMATDPKEAPAGVQIFGSDPGILEEVVERYINPSPFAFLDFNAGCPAPKIVKNGDGSALMKNPKLLGDIVERMKKVSTKPVIIKTRIGWDDDSINIREVAEVIEAAGADAHTIHGRTREAFYQGKANWEIIADVKRYSRGIPIILNGDIRSAEGAKIALESTGCDGLMIGRGAVGNPFIFKEINQYLETGILPAPPTPREKIDAALAHTKSLSILGFEPAGVKEMRKHLVAYTKGLRHATELRNAVFKTESQADITRLLENYWQENYSDE
ncbi:tRNA dihydrouridine synthase DusB [Eubacterium aggregans]|uniref:tRNA dihydrouridine synthase DusB n=1 Tax=Eubacterium aggregans TaxID=81409 RepID=UPI0023EFD18A|nr:tRNA dihydrouridine synthase DusB [Eubacterium aggregans]MDD4691032.1 tRNA dihydrouridine synthase DusB [Eubacterium aggregans]